MTSSATPPLAAAAAVAGPVRDFADAVESRTLHVGVVGLGYVGLPLVGALEAAGFTVTGFDVDTTKVAALERGENYLEHLGDELFATLAASDRFAATSDAGDLAPCDAIVICVPTPLGAHHEPDLSYVLGTARTLNGVLRPGQLVVLESTTYPGTTRDELTPVLVEGTGLVPGRDVFVAYSPEREDPGRDADTRTIPKLVGGLDPVSGALAAAMYRAAVASVVEVESAEIAEAAKLLENVFRAVNIALVNEMKLVLDALGIDVWKVVEAAATKPFGFMPFYPGPGLGGHCIPIDPFYLTWKAREVGQPTQFIELAGLVNTAMPRYVVDRLIRALNDRGRAARGSRVLLIGLAYKAGVSDTRESPSFELIELLRERGVEVDYHDPHVPIAPRVRRHDVGLASVELTADLVASYDAVLIATAHPDVDYELLASASRLIVDTRNAMAAHAAALGERLVKA
ncbi:MAG: nucleotide sugar dehydrogenase [Actinomyces sp.]|nr:MAG: nucleotide sugar dehydrogenase [Actinomyces sp.]